MPTVLNQTRALAVQLNFLDADVISWQLTKQNENKNEAESVWLGAQVIIGGNAKFRFEDASLYRMVTFLWFFHFLTQLCVAAKHTQLLVRIKSSGTIGIIALMEALKKLIGSVSKQLLAVQSKWIPNSSLKQQILYVLS